MLPNDMVNFSPAFSKSGLLSSGVGLSMFAWSCARAAAGTSSALKTMLCGGLEPTTHVIASPGLMVTSFGWNSCAPLGVCTILISIVLPVAGAFVAVPVAGAGVGVGAALVVSVV